MVAVLRRLSEQEECAAYSLSAVVLAVYDEGFSSGVVATAHALDRPVVMTDVGDMARQAAACDVVLSPGWQPHDLVAAVNQASTGAPQQGPLVDEAWKRPWQSLASAIVVGS